MANRKRGLGRDLAALLDATRSSRPQLATGAGDLLDVPVELVQRGKYQPRRIIEPGPLQELADSIKAQGVMQPIVVRPGDAGRYEIIAGERRWRATQLAGLDTIPALVRDVPDGAVIAMALIENIQRENLNAIEEALALQKLQQEFDMTQQEVAAAVGKSRSSVANLLRLLALQTDVRTLLERGELEMGHARALLGLALEKQHAAARTVVGRGFTVRQTEALVRQLSAAGVQPKARAQPLDPNIRQLQDELSQKLGSKVQIQHHSKKGRGKLVLTYYSLAELDGILEHIK